MIRRTASQSGSRPSHQPTAALAADNKSLTLIQIYKFRSHFEKFLFQQLTSKRYTFAPKHFQRFSHRVFDFAGTSVPIGSNQKSQIAVMTKELPVKATVQSLVFVLMVGGILAAGMYPTHSASASTTPIMILGEGTAPAPLCQPGDPKCKPGPVFPYLKDQVAEGTAPAPLCQPGDPKCKPGPVFPYLKETTVMMAEGTAPAPLCQPGDSKCKPGPVFPY